MKEIIYTRIYHFLRFCVRVIFSNYRICPSTENHTKGTPVVYVVHHQNLRGPILCLAWLRIPVRLWVLDVFADQRACYRQFYDYTFTQRLGIPKGLAACLAFPLSFCVSGIMRVIRAIPVFRGSRAIVKTFKQSLTALINGENLMICPDIDYTNKSPHMGEMYVGFLDLERYYFKRTGCHLPYVPLFINKDDRCIYEGNSIYYSEEEDFKKEKIKVYERLKQEFSRLEKLKG